MKTNLNKRVAVLAMLFLAPTSVTQADGLAGKTIETSFFTILPADIFHGLSAESVVGPGIELLNFGGSQFLGSVDIDFSDTNILITSRSNRLGFSGASLYMGDSSGRLPPFASVTVNPATTFPNNSYSIVIDHMRIIKVGISGTGLQDKQLSLDILFAPLVPEPTSAGLMLLSVAFLVARRRRF